jgi:hypothetical protein
VAAASASDSGFGPGGEVGPGVAVEGFRGFFREEGVRQEAGDDAVVGGPLPRERAAFVARQAAAAVEEVVQRRIGRAGVEGEEGAVRFGRGGGGVGPGEVADAPEVEEGHRPGGADPAGQRPVVEGGERRALPSPPHVLGSEIPDDGEAQGIGQAIAVADLERAAPAGVVGQGLAVDAREGHAVESRQGLGMGLFDHAGGGLDLGASQRPSAARKAARSSGR